MHIRSRIVITCDITVRLIKLGVPLKDRLDITYYVVGYIGLIMFLSSFYRASAYIHTHYGIIKLILV